MAAQPPPCCCALLARRLVLFGHAQPLTPRSFPFVQHKGSRRPSPGGERGLRSPRMGRGGLRAARKRHVNVRGCSSPTGMRPPAQGCAATAALPWVHRAREINPKGVVAKRHSSVERTQPLRLNRFHAMLSQGSDAAHRNPGLEEASPFGDERHAQTLDLFAARFCFRDAPVAGGHPHPSSLTRTPS